MIEEREIIVLGGGVSGLAAGSSLGARAVVLEMDDRPGGLVQTPCFDGYWFDRVIHLLHFADPSMEQRLRRLLGDVLQPCPPVAWSVTAAGVARYPLQNHLYGLDPEVVDRCIRDFAEVVERTDDSLEDDFESSLLRTFGRGLCDLFMFPYNRKVWKRPLSSLAPTGFQWNVSRPSMENILEGALKPAQETVSYNANGWYPRAPRDAPIRGMEVLSRALADEVADLRLGHTVTAVDLDTKAVTARRADGEVVRIRYRKMCNTLPLPKFIGLCSPVPASLIAASRQLTWNRVLSVAICVSGPRPERMGHWRYYADPDLVFTRLVFMHMFDPDHAPAHGWGLLAEITEPSEWPIAPFEQVAEQVVADARRTGALSPECEVIGRHRMVIDPAYVAFTLESRGIADEAREFFKKYDVEMLGRYGRWEYSSMAQVIGDGFAWAESIGGVSP